MPRIDVPFEVHGQIITQPTKVKLASGGQNYFYAVFSICETWGDISADAKAVFKRGDISIKVELISRDDGCLECKIPWEVLTKSGIFRVGAYGGDRLTTNLADVEVEYGAYDGDSTPPSEPTPDWESTHRHDDIYYTKEESDKLLSGKMDLIDGKLPDEYIPDSIARVKDIPEECISDVELAQLYISIKK